MCNINYYMVWSVKYRRKILDPEIEEYLQELVQQIPEDKGITGRKLFERFLEIRNQLWKGELWNHSYYVETIGSVSEEISAVIWNIRASHIDSRRNVNFHPQEHTRGEEECYCRIEHL